MPEFILSPQADADLWQIWQFIAQDNPDAASKVIAAAYMTFDLLAYSPNLGKAREMAFPSAHPIRSCPVFGFTKYVVFYQPVDEGVRILRIFHSKRDLENLFT